MAARFWVTGGTGNWNSTTNWSATTGGASGASVPSTADTATFNASSGSGTATLDISPDIQTLTCTGFTGTLAFGTNTISLNSTGTIFTGATTMTVTGTPLIICTNSSATSRTINPGLVSEANAISFRITAGTGNFNMTSGNTNVLNLDFTDGVNPTGYGGSYQSQFHNVYGNFKASTNMTASSGTGTLSFIATSGTKTINTAGVTFDRPFTFNGVGGTWQLQAALTSGATRTCTLTAGTLDLNGYTLTTGIFSSNNSNTRTLAFGTGKIVVTATNATVYTTVTATGLTFTGTPNFEFTGVGIGGETRIINGATSASGGTASNAANINITAGSDTINFGTANRVFNNIQFSGSFSGNIAANVAPQIYGFFSNNGFATITGGTNAWVFKSTSSTNYISSSAAINNPVTFDGVGGAWQIYNNLVINDVVTLTNGTLQIQDGTTLIVGSFATSGTNQKYLQSTTPGTQATLSGASGVNSVSYLTIQDIYATGGATWNAFYYNGNLDNGNNTNWIFGESPAYGAEYEYKLRSFTEPRRF